MPSWNIHTALVEELFSQERPATLGVANKDAYLFGNLIPDLYVGYMVKDASHTLRYIDTHYADPEHIPVPHEQQFWDRYIEPFIASGGVDEMTLGAWAHLLADKRYNASVRAYNAAHHIEPGEETRKRKQHDFELFGHELAPSLEVHVNACLLEQAAQFPQYAIEPSDVKAAACAHRLHIKRSQEPVNNPHYSLISRDFIAQVFDEITQETIERLGVYAQAVTLAGFDPLASKLAHLNLREDLKIGPEPAILLANDPEAAAAVKTPN